MVFHLSRLLLSPVKLKGGGTLLRDHLRIYVRGGRGGRGSEKFNGIGGDGGDVLLEAADGVNLEAMASKNPSRRFTASPGQDSRKFQLIGDKGEDRVIKVPVGITVNTDDRRFICDLNFKGDRVVVATGGKGGCSTSGYEGLKAVPHIVRLDLKLIADIGLVGFPNAGKSTLLKAISRARPRIAGYPFTTVRPQLGMIVYEDGRQISVADLPGLIEGAYMNVGMGHRFLKHVERTYVLLLVIDVFGFKLNAASPERNALDTFLLLCKFEEMELYKPELLEKPIVLCLNKVDKKGARKLGDGFLEKFQLLRSAEEEWENIRAELRPSRLLNPVKVLSISARTRENIDPLLECLRETIDQVGEERRRLKQEKIMASAELGPQGGQTVRLI